MAAQSPWLLHYFVASPGVLGELTRAEISCVVFGVPCSRSYGLLMGLVATVAMDCRRKGSRSKSYKDESHLCCSLQTDFRCIWAHLGLGTLCLVVSLVHRVLMMQVLGLGACRNNTEESVQVGSCCFSGLCHSTGLGNTQSISQRGDGEWRVILSSASAGDHAKMSSAARP